MVGYDIGCAMEGTVQKTPLGAEFRAQGCRFCVNAYHGYAHNFACQCKNHPNNLEGMGLEDLETMERLYSLSNALAPVIRYATKYRRRMLLDLFMRQYDEDKYTNLGIMLTNNYKQALKIRVESGRLLDLLLHSIDATRGDLDRWQEEQRQHFETVGTEPDYDIHRVAYVELLQELRDTEYMHSFTRSMELLILARNVVNTRNVGFLTAVPENYSVEHGVTYGSELSETRRLETARRIARQKVDRLHGELVQMESALHIERRWDATIPAYIDTLSYMARREYQQSLDLLQKLVTQRLFELHRLNVGGIGAISPYSQLLSAYLPRVQAIGHDR
jgi:Kyakuja-Dileera-Zisupton transposase